VLVSSFRNGAKRVLVLINKGVFKVKQAIRFNDITVGSFLPYTSTATENMVQGTAVSAAGNSIIYTLPAGSITTLVEQ